MALPKFEDYKAPWEMDLKEGDEPTFDFEKGKRYLHSVLSDKEKATTKLAEKETELTSLKAKLAEKEREGESEMDKLKRERDEAKAEAEKAKQPDIDRIKLEVAFEKGLTKTQMKRLVGTTKEELEADADELVKEWGPNKGSDEGDDEGGNSTPSRQPRSGMKNPADPKPGDGKIDFGAEADAYLASRGGLF